MKRQFWYLTIGFSVFFLYLFPVLEVGAIQLKRVQHGTVHWAATEASDTVYLGYAVDPSRSFILVHIATDALPGGSGIHAEAREGNAYVKAVFESPTEISLTRLGLGAALDLDWYVVEFSEGAKVREGHTKIDDSTYTKNISLVPAVDATRSLSLTSAMFPSGFVHETEAWKIKSSIDPAGEVLTLERHVLPTGDVLTPAPIVEMVYNILEFTDKDVKLAYGDATIPYNQTSIAVDASAVIDNPRKAFLLFDFTGGSGVSGVDGMIFVRGRINETAKELVFTRGTGGSTDDYIDIHWYLVEFTDNSRVLRGTCNIGADAFGSVSLGEEVDISRAFPVVSTEGASRSNSAFGGSTVRATLLPTTLDFARRNTLNSVEIDWQVIEMSAVEVRTPNGGEMLIMGEDYDITWTAANSIDNVRIEYSDDGKKSWKTIIACTPASTWRYSWTVGYDELGNPALPANEIATNCLIRILNDADYDEKDVSDAAFTMKSKLNLLSPDGAKNWDVGGAGEIMWEYWGVFEPSPTVDLEYSTDYPDYKIWSSIDAVACDCGQIGNISYYSWNDIPMEAGGRNVKVMVRSSNNPSEIFDRSEKPFNVQGNVTVTRPALDELWPTGYGRPIEWTLNCACDVSTRVSIQYSLDYGANWAYIDERQASGIDADNMQDYAEPPAKGSYGWLPPLGWETEGAMIRVFITGDSATSGEVNFVITPSIRVDWPNTGTEVWKVDEIREIRWTIGGGASVSAVDVWYCDDFSGAKTWRQVERGNGIDAGIGPTGFEWRVPDDIGADIGIKVSDDTDPTIYDECDDPFTIKGSLTIVKPASKEIINASRNFDIQWKPHGTLEGEYHISYSNNGGATYTEIYGPDQINIMSGRKTWDADNIPINNIGRNSSKIKIGLVGDESVPKGVYGMSDAFTIRGNIEVTAPNDGDELYEVGDTCRIMWIPYPTGAGVLGEVEISYSRDSGSDRYPADTQLITSGLDASWGVYDWTPIPGEAVTDYARVSVALVDDPTEEVSDESDNDFKIKGRIALTSPSKSGGDTIIWTVGDEVAITWTKEGNIGNLDLCYSRNNGEDSYINVIDNSGEVDPVSGTPYLWTIPQNVFNEGDNGKNTRIRIKAVCHRDPDTYSISTQSVTILARLAELLPNGGEQDVIISENYNISWATLGVIGSDPAVGAVNIKYSINSGLAFNNSIAAGVTNLDGWLWGPVDCPVDDEVRIRVESASYPGDIHVESVGDIAVKGKLEITSPHSAYKSADSLVVGDSHLVTWIVNGGLGTDVGDIKLYHWTGTSWSNPIKGINSAALGYRWTVPDNPNTITNKIKLEDDDNASVYDESETFDIRGNLDLISPDGGEIFKVEGKDIDVQWVYTGSIGDVGIYYDTRNGDDGYPNRVSPAPVDYDNNKDRDGLCHYSWSVPEIVGTKYRIKIKQITDPWPRFDIEDASTANFTVKGVIDLTWDSNGGGVWQAGLSKDITWSRIGSHPEAVIFLIDAATGGILYDIARRADANADFYAWTMPADSDSLAIERNDNVKFRVVCGDIDEVSDKPLTVQSRLVLTHPSNETLYVKQAGNYDIEWHTYGSISGVKLCYDMDEGAGGYNLLINDGKTITNSVTNGASNAFNWTVPNSIGTKIRVKVESFDPAYCDHVYAVSVENNEIKGRIVINAPDSNAADVDSWIVDGAGTLLDRAHTISWENFGDLGDVEIYYSPDGGVSHVLLDEILGLQNAPEGTDGKHSCYWKIPGEVTIDGIGYNTIGTDNKIRILNASDPENVKDETNNFEIKGKLKLLEPVGGEVYYYYGADEAIEVRWLCAGDIGNVDIWCDTEGGSGGYPDRINAGTISCDNNKDASGVYRYAWRVPRVAGKQYRVKVEDRSDTTHVYSTSTGDFAVKGAIVLSAPGMDGLDPEIWHVDDGSNNTISWSVTGDVESVDIHLDTTGGGDNYGIEVVRNLDAGSSPYTWVIPEGQYVNVTSDDCRIRVRNSDEATTWVTSDYGFRIKPKIYLDTLGDTPWVVEETRPISWTIKGNIGTLRIYYSNNGGASWHLEKGSVPASKRNFLWYIDSGNAAGYEMVADDKGIIKLIRYDDGAEDSLVADSSSAFTVYGKINLLSPVEPTDFLIGEEGTVRWATDGLVGEVAVQYSKDSENAFPPESYITIKDGIGSSRGICTFGVPDDPAARVKFRVVEGAKPAVNCATSVCAIKGTITLIEPGMDDRNIEKWVIGTTPNTISWDVIGKIRAVDILLDIDGGKGSYVTSVKMHYTGVSPYIWTIPPELYEIVTSDTCRIRVRDYSDTSVGDESRYDFKVKPGLVINIPDTSGGWMVGEAKDIAWTIKGDIAGLNLYYSNNGGTSWVLQNRDTAIRASLGSYSWTIPEERSISYGQGMLKLVRLRRGIEDEEVQDETFPFTVTGELALKSPLSPQAFPVLEERTISWDAYGEIKTVAIRYAKDAPTFRIFNTIKGAERIPAASSTCTFSIPDDPEPHVVFRVLEEAHEEVFCQTPACSIIGSIALDKSTVENKAFIAGAQYTIKWQNTGSFKRLAAYCIKDGGTPNIIDDNLRGTSESLAWVPGDDDISEHVVIRVEDYYNPVVYDETSPGAENMVAGYLELVSPNEPADYSVGKPVPVQWKKYGNIGDLKFELWDGHRWLNKSGGSGLPDKYPAGDSGATITMTPDWMIPDKIYGSCKVRVTSLKYPDLSDESDSTFAIKGAFMSMPYPASGDDYYVGENGLISWNVSGTMEAVKVELSVDKGKKWFKMPIEAGYDNGGRGLNSGYNEYTWKGINDQRSERCKIRISSVVNPDVKIESDMFRIKPRITVATPSAPWGAGTYGQVIEWDAIPGTKTGKINIRLSLNNGDDGFPHMLGRNIPKENLSYTVTKARPLPKTATANARIRVMDYKGSCRDFVYGDSGTFSIVEKDAN